MGELGGPVERAYLVNFEDLRDICSGLTEGKREYKDTCDDEMTVAISYNDGPDDLNAVCFTFPIIRNLCLSQFLPLRLDEGALMVCMHVYTGKAIRRGLYFEGDEPFLLMPRRTSRRLRFAQHKSRHRINVASLGDFRRSGFGGLKVEDASNGRAFAPQPPAQ